jgi:hypothetical protein
MDRLLLIPAALLAAAATSAPAAAQSWDGSPGHGFHDEHRDGDGRHRGDMHHRHRNGGSDGIFVEYDAGAWAFYNNRSWQPDSYNDWWHDRPDRAFPRWVQHNQNCSPDRMWWSGNGWHC